MSGRRQKLIRKLALVEEPEDTKARTKLIKKYKHPEHTPSLLLRKLKEKE